MKINKMMLVLGVILGAVLLTSSYGWAQLFQSGGESTKPGTHAPAITNAFAVDKGPYGYIWKIYLEANDPDSDMIRIASVVEQPGLGRYPTFWTVVRPQYQKQFKGYLEWNTFSSRTPNMPEWTYFTLKVSILDKNGNWSNEVAFPFSFETGVPNPYGYKLPPPFDKGDLPRLGNIAIDLYSPMSMGSSSRGRED